MTIKSTQILFSILLFIGLISCESEQEINYIRKPIYCQNSLKYLFSVPDSIPQFEIDFGMSKDSIFDLIESHFENDTCWHHKIFGLVLDSSMTVKINYSKKCPTDGYVACGSGYRNNTIFKTSLNSKGELLMEGDLSTINHIALSVYHKFPHEYSSNVFSIIKWREETPSDTINTVIKEIIRGYSLSYKKLANDIFDKQLHQLNRLELDSLKSILPFNLKLLEIERNNFINPPILIKGV